MAAIKDKSDRDFKLRGRNSSLDFNKIQVGKGKLENDVFLDTDFFNENRHGHYYTREMIERAIRDRNLREIRAISRHFFSTNGIYSRLCRYMAYLYRYDYFVTPIVYDKDYKEDKLVNEWYQACDLLDNSDLKKTFGRVALKVIKEGCYYGYVVKQKTACYIQELPVDYCRSRYDLNGSPAVEFNIKYFDDTFSDIQYRLKVLKMFPVEFQKAYLSYKKNNLPKDYTGDDSGWFLIEPGAAIKFNLSDSDAPLFISVIPDLLDLEEAQDLDKKKMKQQLLKIIVQKMPMDKNGDLVLDVDEARQLHANAINMLGKSIGVDVLTTFAEVDDIDLSDTGALSTADPLERTERTVYNSAGVSQMQFNTDGNIALEKSIANDEATMFDLVLQFEKYMQTLLAPFNKNVKRVRYKVQMLPTTIYNYEELSKTYKEHTMLGYSKLLPQIALGVSQTNIIASTYFENEVLNLDDLFVAPQMSSTMSSSDKAASADSEGGRPELKDEQKETRTIQNEESKS